MSTDNANGHPNRKRRVIVLDPISEYYGCKGLSITAPNDNGLVEVAIDGNPLRESCISVPVELLYYIPLLSQEFHFPPLAQEQYEEMITNVTTAKEKALSRQEGGKHYKGMVIEPVEYIHKNDIGFCAGNVIKYVSRYKQKNGVEDLKKARHYIDMLIEFEQKAP